MQHKFLYVTRSSVTRLGIALALPVEDGVASASVVGARFGEKTGPNVIGTRQGLDLRRLHEDQFIKSDDVHTFMQVRGSGRLYLSP